MEKFADPVKKAMNKERNEHTGKECKICMFADDVELLTGSKKVMKDLL